MPCEKDADLSTSENIDSKIDKLRKTVRFYIDANCNESALFWADKVATMSNEDPRDLYWLAQSMYRCGEYHRAAVLIKNRGLDKTQPLFKWLAGLCFLEAKEYNEALHVLMLDDQQIGINKSMSGISAGSVLSTPAIANGCILEGFTSETLRSAFLLLKGRIYQKLGSRSCAAESFKQALKYDIYCYDAFQELVQHQMLTVAEERELLSSLPFKAQCDKDDILPWIYEELLDKYQSPPKLSHSLIKYIPRIKGNLDLQEVKAERLYYTCDYKRCLELSEEILKKDPYHRRTLPIYISCLVELAKTNELFYLAHDLVNIMPDRAISWFAVGCYYFSTGNQNLGRRYLSKAVSLDKHFGPAWLVYGHSFAKEHEHDQATAAYFSAAKLMRGSPFPLLYVGVECGLTNNLKLAEQFFTQAISILPHDPFVFHEMGTIAFQNKDYHLAEKHFLTALKEIYKNSHKITAQKWEPLLNNLGHTLRKLKKYSEAIEYHKQALVLSSQNPSSLANIGFVQALQGDFVNATDTFHKVLTYKQDDSFSVTMLSYLVEQLA